MTEFAVESRPAGERAQAIALQGGLTSRAEADLAAAADDAAASGIRHLLLDLDGVQYMNSSGIALLVRLLRHARRQDQDLVAFGGPEHIRLLFDITGLGEVLHLCRDEGTALAYFGS